jgi:putative intracellular protease/amidase
MRILLPLPDHDFDVTEVAVPWHVLKRAGHEVVFATELGAEARCDPLLLSGVIFGQLGAEPEPRRLYAEMQQSPAFLAPLRWDGLSAQTFDALLLPGGHAQGMRPYLESPLLQRIVVEMMRLGRPVAAICHGVLVLARSRIGQSSVLEGRRATCLPMYMERIAYWLTAWKLGRYYRTYPAYVEEEVRLALGIGGRFERGPIHLFARGSDADDRAGFVVEDGNLITARWPGDAWLLGKSLLSRLQGADM